MEECKSVVAAVAAKVPEDPCEHEDPLVQIVFISAVGFGRAMGATVFNTRCGERIPLRRAYRILQKLREEKHPQRYDFYIS